MVVVDGLGTIDSKSVFVDLLPGLQEINQVRRLVTDGEQPVAIVGVQLCKLSQALLLETGVLGQHGTMERTILVELKMSHDSLC